MDEVTLPLVQQIALDLACSCLYGSETSEDPVLVLPSSQTIANVIGQRLNKFSSLRTEDDTVAPRNMPHYTRALWAAPKPSTWRDDLRTIDQALSLDGVLSIVLSSTGGWLGAQSVGMLQSWLLARDLGSALGALGYRREQEFSLGGVEAMWWAMRVRLAKLRGRPELADRAEAGYRLALTSPGQPLAFRLVWQLRKGQHQ